MKKFPLKHFPGGRSIHQGGELSSAFPVKTPPLLERYTVVVHQNIGAPPTVLAQKGDKVRKGSPLAKASGFVSANLHSPTSGTVQGLIDIPGVTGARATAFEILADGEDTWELLPPIQNWLDADPKILLQRVSDAGLVGMGGAAFPAHVKLSPPPEAHIDTLIINGAECEPYLTADDRLMVENAARCMAGVAMFARILNVKHILIGVEDDKDDAILSLRMEAAKFGAEVVSLPVRYPQGAEKQLIYALTGRKVRPGALPSSAGAVVMNIGTAHACAAAVLDGQPLVERTVTVTGEPVQNPGNWKFKIGTPVFNALEWAGGVKYPPAKLILGGPMMGFAQRSLEVTVCKNTSGILLLGPEQTQPYEARACIRCGRCVEGCPMNLICCALSSLVENERFEEAEKLHAMDCMECGCCAYMCPSKRPLVQQMRRAKGEIIARRRQANAKK